MQPIRREDHGRARRGARRYIWREEVLRAEPRAEIRISKDEMKRVMQQLDVYFGP